MKPSNARIGLLAWTVLLGGCCCPSGGGGSTTTTTTPTPGPAGSGAAGITITSVTFGRAINAQGRIDQPTAVFAPTDTEVRTSIVIDGRPTSGSVEQRLIGEWQEAPVASATVDLSQVNGSVIFSVGEQTYVTGRFAMNAGAPFYISNYRVEVRYNGNVVGSYPFRVAPAPGAIPTRLLSATLAKGASPERTPVEPTTTFGPTDTPHIVGSGDFGQHSWLEVRWMTNGVVHREGGREARFPTNTPASPFFFSFRPEAGWPAGQHEVVLLMDGPVVGRYPFTVGPAAAGAPPAPVAPPSAAP